MKLLKEPLVVALLLLAWLSGCAEDREAPVSVAWEASSRLGLCLRRYERANGHYPDALSDLQRVAADATDGCHGVDAPLLSAGQVRFAGFDWTYWTLSGRKAFVLSVASEPQAGQRCFIRLDQTFVLWRTCERWWGPSVDSKDLAAVGNS